MTLLQDVLVALVLLACCCSCCGAAQVRTNHESRPRARAEAMVCCAPKEGQALAAGAAGLAPGLEAPRCCGKGWGVHCCRGGVCCLDDQVVPDDKPPAALHLRDSFWQFKHWAQWLNLAVVVMIVALVCAVLVCCWRRDRALRRHGLLAGADLFSYGTSPGGHNPSAPHMNPPMVSRWVDFSYRQPVGGTAKPGFSPYYQQAGPRVVQYYPTAV